MRNLKALSILPIAGLIISVQVLSGHTLRDQIRQSFNERTVTQGAEYSTQTIQVGDQPRTYLLHTPSSARKGKLLPLVFVLHGGSTPAERMIGHTGMNAIADREGFIVVYPKGTGDFWNDGRERAPKADDVGFIRALITHLEKTLNVDRRRIYAAGISNGGMLSQRLACELSDKITAVASIAASMPENFAPQCKPTAPVSVLMIHGTDDPLVPYHGGQLSRASNIGGSIWSVRRTIKYWAAFNRCAEKPTTDVLRDKDRGDSTRVRHEKYAKCASATDVVLYVVEGGGHTWPGATQYLPESLIGRTSKDLDGSAVVWEFFKPHSKK